MPDRTALMLDLMITAVDEGFSYDGICSIPEAGLEDISRPGLAGFLDVTMESFQAITQAIISILRKLDPRHSLRKQPPVGDDAQVSPATASEGKEGVPALPPLDVSETFPRESSRDFRELMLPASTTEEDIQLLPSLDAQERLPRRSPRYLRQSMPHTSEDEDSPPSHPLFTPHDKLPRESMQDPRAPRLPVSVGEKDIEALPSPNTQERLPRKSSRDPRQSVLPASEDEESLPSHPPFVPQGKLPRKILQDPRALMLPASVIEEDIGPLPSPDAQERLPRKSLRDPRQSTSPVSDDQNSLPSHPPFAVRERLPRKSSQNPQQLMLPASEDEESRPSHPHLVAPERSPREISRDPRRLVVAQTSPAYEGDTESPQKRGLSERRDQSTTMASPLPMPRSNPDAAVYLDGAPSEEGASVLYQESQWASAASDVLEMHSARESEKIEQLQHKLRELQKRLEALSRDSQNSNSYLNAADKSSDSDVIRALQRLNAELQQSTTYMADCLAEDLEFRSIIGDEPAIAQKLSERVGHALVDALGTAARMPEEIPLLLQIAFQACLVSELRQMVSSWTPGLQDNTLIAGVYQKMCESEPQAVSGRWRILTRSHINQNYITHPESPVNRIIEDLSGVLLVAGCTSSPSDITSKIISNFREKIIALVELAGRLNKMFDDIISSDFAVTIGEPGQKFENDFLEDTDGGRVVRTGRVLCVTHLGLIKRVPVGTLWEQGQKQVVTVLKAKVLLESFLEAENK